MTTTTTTDWTLKPTAAGGVAGPLLLVILDGVGIYAGEKEGYPGNAIDLAQAPTFKSLLQSAPITTLLKAHGKAVGLPSDGDMGNSEVGHNAMGAGRVFAQGAKLVNDALASRRLFQGKCWMHLIGNPEQPGLALQQQTSRSVHFLGLLSDGNVHSHINHLLQLIDECAHVGVQRVYVHTLMDGRDVEKDSGLKYIDMLEEKLDMYNSEERKYEIASGGGRMKITMDRYEADWNMVLLGWKTHVVGDGRKFPSAAEAIKTYRKEYRDKGVKLIDQDIPPFVIADKDGKPKGRIQNDDIVIFFNFRGDRAIEISKVFTEENFGPFPRVPNVKVHYAGMMEYDGDNKIPPNYLVDPPLISRTLSEYLAKNSVATYAISETQKYGHVTYFWNGNRPDKFSEKLETWVEIPSDNISFDKAPRMKADEITKTLTKALKSGKYKFLRTNYANGDMVGHTGNLGAAIKAVEALDENLAKLIEVVEQVGGTMVITADHGNCDQMYEIDKGDDVLSIKQSVGGSIMVKTSHTLSPVPFLLVGRDAEKFKLNEQVESPSLGNIAATLLTLMGYEAPEDYMPPIVVPKSAEAN